MSKASNSTIIPLRPSLCVSEQAIDVDDSALNGSPTHHNHGMQNPMHGIPTHSIVEDQRPKAKILSLYKAATFDRRL